MTNTMSHNLEVAEELEAENIPKELLLYTSVNDAPREHEGVLPKYS